MAFMFLYTYAAITYMKKYNEFRAYLQTKCKKVPFELVTSMFYSIGAFYIYTSTPGYRLHGPVLYLIFSLFYFAVLWFRKKGWFIKQKKEIIKYTVVAVVMVVINDIMYMFPANDRRPNVWIGYGFLLGIAIVTILNLIDYSQIRKLHTFCTKYPKRTSWIAYGLITFLSFATLETLSGNFVFTVLPQHWLMNMVWFFILSGLVYVIFHKMKPALLFALVLMSVLGIANGFIVLFRGCPILPSDLYLINTAMAVSGNYSFRMPFYMYIGLAVFIETLVLTLRIKDTEPVKKERRTFALIYGLVVVLSVPTFYLNASLLKGSINLWRPVKTYRQYGSLNGFGINLCAMKVQKPEGYSAEAANDVLAGYTSDVVTGDEKLPNVIGIMCEAFSDLSVIGDYDTNEEVLPYLTSLQDNTIKGYAYASVVGGTTANSEYEFLTGNATTFLPTGTVPYQQFIQGETYSFTKTLRSLGYSATALHAYRRNTYRRELVYPLIGFEQYLAQESFEDPEYLRTYITDEEDFNKVIELYENRDTTKPFFMWNVTMQNHSSYDTGNMEYNIKLKGKYSSGYEDAEEYLSCISHTDEALKTIIDYFSKQEEPTYIIFYGDHQPNLDSGFFEALFGDDIENLSTEDLQKRYAVPFFIWSNQELEEKTVEAISINYLSSFFLQEAGMPMTAYNKYLMDLYKKYPIVNVNGYMDADGNHYDANQTRENEDLLGYNMIVYNAIMENYKGLDWAYQLQGVEQPMGVTEEIMNAVKQSSEQEDEDDLVTDAPAE